MTPLFVVALLAAAVAPASAQVPEAVDFVAPKSAGKAALLSLAVPGLGHRYAHGGSWRGMATAHALAEASLWLGLVSAGWREDHVIESYRTLAVTAAGADLAGKDRRFFLNLANYASSDEFLDAQLRNRSWDQVDYTSDPSFQWRWQSLDALQDYRDLRDEADAWSRRRTVFISTLVANRLIAALGAVRAARRTNPADAPGLSLSLSPPPPDAGWPALHLGARW